MSLSNMLVQVRAQVEQAVTRLRPPYTLFFSISDGKRRALVRHITATDFPNAWQSLAKSTQKAANASKMDPCWLRVDWVTQKTVMTLASLEEILHDTKRSYFRYGLAMDGDCEVAFLEQELNANAMLYGGNKINHVIINENNFLSYAKQRFGPNTELDFSEDKPVILLSTEGLFFEPKKNPVALYGPGLDAGRRIIEKLTISNVTEFIESSSRYLSSQVKKDGAFFYGWHACFDRQIDTYNNLRHASSTYAMIEAWEVTGDETLLNSILRSLKHLTEDLIKTAILPSGATGAFLVEENNEIKLGGNAVSILALVKYAEVSKTDQYAELMEQLALAIEYMQDPATGQFSHVLEYPDLQVKDKYRVIYYDGEAAFGLMRLYGLTKDSRWLSLVEKAFDYFIHADHWRAHDHWLSYCVNELTIYRPEEKYYQFGIRNFASYLDFVENRITTFPTLLELMMAAEKMVTRLQGEPEFQYLLDQVDLEHFYRALHKRAMYLLNGYFWPEFAMYFRNPKKIVGSFFIRHHAFRVRIDDVEHYLSGFIAYRKYLLTLGDIPQKFEEKTLEMESEPPVEPHNSLPVLAWGGDVNLSRRQHYRTAQFGTEKVLGTITALKKADISVINLECVVATEGEQGISKGESSPYYYRARPEMLSVLMDAGIDIVATANNHSGDYGPDALMEQQHWLNSAGIGHCGSGINIDKALEPVYRPAGRLNIAIFSLDATQPRFAAGPDTAGCAHLPLTIPHLWLDNLKPRISAAREKAHLVFVAVHWGKNKEPVPSEDEIAIGHAIIDAGADGILGTSAHNLQGVEIYRDRPIIHDAGDLLFDAVRKSLADSGIFRLHLSEKGVEQITFVPVGVGFGFSKQLSGDKAKELTQRYSESCLNLGTQLTQNSDGSGTIQLSPPARQYRKLPKIFKTQYKRDAITDQRPLKPNWTVDQVPLDARIPTIECGPLKLLGVRFYPREIKSRQMLWVESFWTTDYKLQEDFRLDFRAIPIRKTSMPYWGKSMDHDPCDWQVPTSRWQPGVIYRDLYGLRAPAKSEIQPIHLHLAVGLISNTAQIKPVLVGGMITQLNLSGKTLAERSKAPVYNKDFPPCVFEHHPGQTWNAEQISAIAGGKWLVPPPEGWFVRSVISGSSFIEESLDPILFVAHTNLDRVYHERSSKIPTKFWDFHQKLPSFANKLAGVIVSKPVAGIPKDLPVLEVPDPIKVIIELGLAARERFNGDVIAVTGTAGKSTTLKMIKQMLGPREKVLSSLGNYNSRVGAPTMMASLNQDHEVAVIEVAQSALWMKRGPITRQVKPTIALITEIGMSQTSHHVKSVEDTAKWKSRIYDGLTGPAIAIAGEHLECFDYVLNKAKKHAKRIIIFGESPNAEVRILRIRTDESGSWVQLKFPKRELELRVPAPSLGMLHNAIASICAVYALNRDLDEAALKLQELRLDDSHLQRTSMKIHGKSINLIDDSWNATVSSMLNAFSVFAQTEAQDQGRKIAVLGRIVHLGEKAQELHESLSDPLMQSQVDWVVTHGEEMKYLRQVLPEEILGPHFSEAAPLVNYLADFFQDSDLILLKGSRRDSDFGSIPALLDKLQKTGQPIEAE
ncbi:UDP-N-acetylmuramoyl-tripeptide--D-alanyl-D-alanine ligase [Microbulbifer sp. A4B17]|uniref:CapA family protein n=1 Tax=Microbulbifer sp. A4B17 TaxID=359370 RepID=UPI000D52BE5A|nr:CapA family protein [Microbulbifer sp. A4B17]AWF80491.1 UDP-N-acetylmuramoyl-tripeptide--D-alanyl-D-alanine ligase [Microbulbifer sp. A4B17]